mmetsp:Transcript_24024/g.52291  ORF Transcript_24024/g.52291 Transcript_24024/m.52291 type:complete len:96 (+) Transcript_24024:294-581(+)
MVASPATTTSSLGDQQSGHRMCSTATPTSCHSPGRQQGCGRSLAFLHTNLSDPNNISHNLNNNNNLNNNLNNTNCREVGRPRAEPKPNLLPPPPP